MVEKNIIDYLKTTGFSSVHFLPSERNLTVTEELLNTIKKRNSDLESIHKQERFEELDSERMKTFCLKNDIDFDPNLVFIVNREEYQRLMKVDIPDTVHALVEKEILKIVIFDDGSMDNVEIESRVIHELLHIDGNHEADIDVTEEGELVFLPNHSGFLQWTQENNPGFLGTFFEEGMALAMERRYLLAVDSGYKLKYMESTLHSKLKTFLHIIESIKNTDEVGDYNDVWDCKYWNLFKEARKDSTKEQELRSLIESVFGEGFYDYLLFFQVDYYNNEVSTYSFDNAIQDVYFKLYDLYSEGMDISSIHKDEKYKKLLGKLPTLLKKMVSDKKENMNEHVTPIQPEEIIAYICERGDFGGGWVDFESYSKSDLQNIKRAMEKKNETDGDSLTQQKSPMDNQLLTYKEVLTKTLVSVNQAIMEKEVEAQAGSESSPYKIPSYLFKDKSSEEIKSSISTMLEEESMAYANYEEGNRRGILFIKIDEEIQKWNRNEYNDWEQVKKD